MNPMKTAVIHYTAPPVVGGVEAVLYAHAQVFSQFDYPLTIVAGRGDQAALPGNTGFILIPEMDTRHPKIADMNAQLEDGKVPDDFNDMVDVLMEKLTPVAESFDTFIIHNIFSKHFNLPLTSALNRLLDVNAIRNCIHWGHDFTWTSEHSRHKVHPGYPWDFLRTYRPDVTYVTVSKRRQREQAELMGLPKENIHVIYNGVNPEILLGLSETSKGLVDRLELMESDLILLMPVRVTQAKNIEFALHVVAELKEKGIRPKLLLTGPPDPHDVQSMDYFRSLQALRQELKIEPDMRFVFESGPSPDHPFTIDPHVVGELYRVCDMMFMPSHREGYGMPVLEAGLVGKPVLTTEVPAAEEIGGGDVRFIRPGSTPTEVAESIISWMDSSHTFQLRRRLRKQYTWKAIFQKDIEPLLKRV